MNIALINGSPKVKDSASGCILQELKPFLERDSNTIYEYSFRKPDLGTIDINHISECNALVFAFPLYVDGILSHLLSCLVKLEELFLSIKDKDVIVYSIANCGFYEGHQNALALEIIENWCAKTGLRWGQGIGMGAGGMLISTQNVPIGKGPKKSLGTALSQFSNNILIRASDENLFITANFPRFLYKLAAEMGWRHSIKANGLKKKDLFLRK